MTFDAVPADIWRRAFRQSAALDPSTWNLAALDPLAQRFDQNFTRSGDWTHRRAAADVASGSATTGALSNQLTVNYGVRWDDDRNVASPPGRRRPTRF